jgi:GNAT superfamily N-acetyltransferase
MIIRRGLITDIFELSRLWVYMAKECDTSLSPDIDMWRGYISNLMNYKGYFMFVAEVDNKLIGFIDYVMQPEPGKGIWLAVINYFYVLPEYREKEVSGLLWKAAIKSAKSNNASEFFSFCFPEKLKFWEKHGFKTECFTIRREIA